ncbi:carboxy-cis,cis-muconate cyclase [Hypoxylon crocopeplum]|nr:carboxy-cis,cis-muconate cyclase [Hypoxylon crocopeplum]
MHYTNAILAVLGFVALAEASKHYMFIGTFSTKFLYTAVYEDTTGTLALYSKHPTNEALSWITLSHDKTNLYGTDWNATTPSFVTLSVDMDLVIHYKNKLVGDSDCTGGKSAFITANRLPPYTVYGTYLGGNAKCETVMSVNDSGLLHSVVQEFEYVSGSAVQGLSFSNGSRYLYSADGGNNALWVHDMSQTDGSIKSLWRLPMPEEKANPRRVVSHPADAYIYTVLEGTSEVAQCLTSNTGELYLLKQTYPLIGDGEKPSDFWASEIALSATGKYLWASNRARYADGKGYLSAIEVTAEGQLKKQLFLTNTANNGGFPNTIAPSPFDDGIVVVTDNSTGFVQIWKMDDDEKGAQMIAHLDIPDGGCCANAVWYD